MNNLDYYKEKIKQKRKITNFRNYLKEITSWYPLVLNKREFLSRYPKTIRSPKLISTKEFFENIDNNLNYGFNFDFSKTFFENFQKLFLKVPLSPLHIFRLGSENADYADIISDSKNVYLSFNVTRGNENILYSLGVKENGKDIFNSIMVWDNSEVIFNSHGIIKSFKIFYSKFIYNSNNIWLSSNLIGCSECILCNNLENQKYCIKNKKYSREEYLLEKEKILKNKSNFIKIFNKISNIGMNLGDNKNVDAIFAINSENVDKGIFLYNVKNSKNVILAGYSYGMENIYDALFCGAKNNCYGVISTGKKAENIYNSFGISGGINNFYSYNLSQCSFCIGCIGLRNKSYCILNKQYSKEEWEKLASKIFETMEKDGTLGDFFPAKLNPFYFNDTVAGLIGGFKKEEVIKEGFMWRDEKIKVDIPDESIVVKIEELDKYEGFDENGNWKINTEILKKVIKTEKGDYYRIVKMEYDFLVKHGLPLPRLHWLERMKVNFGV